MSCNSAQFSQVESLGLSLSHCTSTRGFGGVELSHFRSKIVMGWIMGLPSIANGMRELSECSGPKCGFSREQCKTGWILDDSGKANL